MPAQDIERRARDFATAAHQRIDHRRKYSNQPYEVHLKGVAALVRSVTDDAEVVAAAWMHDLVEDTPVTFDEIRREFGERVAGLVREVTDVSRPGDGNRSARKAIDRRHLAIASTEAKTIKLADLLDNARDICRHDPRFAVTYLREMRSLLGVLDAGDAQLYRKAWALWTKEAARLGVALEPAEAGSGGDVAEPRELFAMQEGIAAKARRFAEVFGAGDIAEPVLAFDATTPCGAIRAVLASGRRLVAVLRDRGLPVGFVMADQLGADAEAPRCQPFRADQVLAADAPLPDVIEVLTRYDVAFVESFGVVCGVVRRSDMQKPAVRMWLFGTITTIEMLITGRVCELFPGERWRALLSAGRLAKAIELREERTRLGEYCDLIDCMQFGDKVAILLSDPDFPRLFGYKTRSAVKDGMNDLQRLRNHLAHAQDIVSQDWVQIARLAREVARLAR